MKKVVVSLLVIMMAISFTGIAAAQTTCPAATTATTCAAACPATTCAQSTSCATSSCTTACPTKCPTPCPTVCCPTVTCCPVVTCVATTSCCPVTVACPVVKETPKVEAKEAKEAAAIAEKEGQAAAQSSTGSTKSPQVSNNNVWTQTQTYAPVNTFNIYKNDLGGVTTGDQKKMDSDIDNTAFIKVSLDQDPYFATQVQKNTVDIKNVEVNKDYTKTVDIDKTIIKGSYNDVDVTLPTG